LAAQPVVESTSHFDGFALGVGFVLMLMAGSLLHGLLRDRGFGILGNGVFLFVGIVIGVFVMRGCQAFL
jgi:hypothetical protein